MSAQRRKEGSQLSSVCGKKNMKMCVHVFTGGVKEVGQGPLSLMVWVCLSKFSWLPCPFFRGTEIEIACCLPCDFARQIE